LEQVSPQDNFSTGDDKVTVSGQTDPGNKISINNQDVPVDSNGKFSQTVALNPGTNRISIVATDPNGNQTKSGFIYDRVQNASQGTTTTTSNSTNSQSQSIRTGGFDLILPIIFVILLFVIYKFYPKKSKI
jgi:hypothetical protein